MRSAEFCVLIVGCLRDSDALIKAGACNVTTGLALDEDFRREVGWVFDHHVHALMLAFRCDLPPSSYMTTVDSVCRSQRVE